MTTSLSFSENSAKQDITLVVMAAGLGSRFGGDKQLAKLGPQGETMLELSIASAIKAGFSAAVIVTRSELIEPLTELLRDLPQGFSLSFCVQQMLDLPAECLTIVGDGHYRTKPWGTAHALWSARHQVNTPMVVINADDFYGDQAFKLLAAGFQQQPERWQLVAYRLQETLSDNGGVNRGICLVDGDYLTSVEEWLDIAWQRDELLGRNGVDVAKLDPQSLVSMTCWGFTPQIFTVLGHSLSEFVKVFGLQADSECYLPAVVQQCLPSQYAEPNANIAKDVYVNTTDQTWLGVTYPEDTAWVKQKLLELMGD
ncbi:NTP transferase domain-containing protein [Shewanella sp. Isolate11]|uniref:NTP transferase domain-containing protein n=1 Tax=Shewanella sp. Isolate11 TaxID=2908530 RepID=UPI001EFEA795|nr:NTP transferase domain-containing protein [Shewanella sp. Isolate11]MCG9697816.1 NTP transferase domain-containing protein [Shewanella sp. Isolate11]